MLALAYHWPPAVGREMDVDEFAEWVKRAQQVLKSRGAV